MGKAVEMEIKRTHMMCCAAKLFLQKGYSGTSIRELADVADVSPATFYQSFGDKEGLRITDSYFASASKLTIWM